MGRDRLAEIGKPIFVDSEAERAERAWRLQRRREVRPAVRRRWLGALVVGFVVAFVAAGVIANVATVSAGDVAFWVTWPAVAALVIRSGVRRRLRPLKPGVEVWRTRRQSNASMVDALRMSLGSDWTVLWDRRLPDWATPVALLVGPPGVWVLWTATPGTVVEEAAQRLVDRFAPLLPDWLVRSHVAGSTADDVELRRFATGLALTPGVVLSAGDRQRLVRYLEDAVPAELTAVPAVWPTSEPRRSGGARRHRSGSVNRR
jgi:hypothetical protein